MIALKGLFGLQRSPRDLWTVPSVVETQDQVQRVRLVELYACMCAPPPLRHLWAELFALKGLLYTLLSYVQRRHLSLTYFFALNPAVPMVLLCDFGKVSKRLSKFSNFAPPPPRHVPEKPGPSLHSAREAERADMCFLTHGLTVPQP